jgi:hypothetical protein
VWPPRTIFAAKTTTKSGRGLTEALKNKDFGAIFDWFSAYFFAGAILSMLFVVAAAVPSKGWDAVRIVGLSFMFACACTVCGWLLGLLFGIPRTLSRPQAAPLPGPAAGAGGAGNSGPAASSPNRVNTNLEDVSDWLTKTLVGVGLTQLYFVPHYIWQSADKLNKAGFMWDGPGQLLAVALFLYFAPGGFWLGYIGTRTILTKLFDSLEGPTAEVVNTALSEPLKIDVQGKIDPSTTPKTHSADAALLALPLSALNTSRELAAWGAAKARNNDLESATVALQQATQSDPSDPQAKQALATVYTAQSRKTEAQKVLQGQDQDNEVGLFVALYQDPPAGFTRAIQIGSRLEKRPDAETNLNLHVWLACAYGQQHAFATANNDSGLAEEARKNVVREIEIAVGIDAQKAKPLLRAFWQAQSGATDNDLASIPQDDSDLKRLLLP